MMMPQQVIAPDSIGIIQDICKNTKPTKKNRYRFSRDVLNEILAYSNSQVRCCKTCGSIQYVKCIARVVGHDVKFFYNCIGCDNTINVQLDNQNWLCKLDGTDKRYMCLVPKWSILDKPFITEHPWLTPPLTIIKVGYRSDFTSNQMKCYAYGCQQYRVVKDYPHRPFSTNKYKKYIYCQDHFTYTSFLQYPLACIKCKRKMYKDIRVNDECTKCCTDHWLPGQCGFSWRNDFPEPNWCYNMQERNSLYCRRHNTLAKRTVIKLGKAICC